jgi:dopamine beta-monooxygenase
MHTRGLAVLTVSTWLLSAHAINPDEYFGGNNTGAYLDWVASLGDDYPATVFLPSSADPNKGAALHWRIADDEHLDLAIAMQATGWIGFGLTINGGMTGADMVLVEASDLSVAKDAYVQDERFPQEDDCQDWKLVDAAMDDGFFLVKLRRKLDTGDNQDHAIRNDADLGVPVSRVIAAWGESETVSYHGPDNNARGSIRWYSPGTLEEEVFALQMSNQSDGHFRIGPKNYTIPAIDTMYSYFCFNTEDLEALGVNMTEGVTIIGIDAFIDNAKHVHHFILEGTFTNIEDTANCSRASALGEVAYPWAPGDPPFTLPDNVGFKLGGNEGGYKSFLLEVHYDNMNLEEGQVDSSGVEVFFSTSPREYTAGFFQVGDPTVSLRGQELEAGVSDYSFDCPSDCSGLVIQEPVTVLREYLHMHKSGYSTYFEQTRNGTIVRRGSVEYYDFDQTGNPAVQADRYEIHPGDSFTMRCYFKNEEGGRTFGLGSSNEMCISFVLYYPRQYIPVSEDIQVAWMCGVGFADFGLPQCETEVTTRVLTSDEAPARSFGTPTGGECGADTGGSEEEPSSGASANHLVNLAMSSVASGLLAGLFMLNLG